MKSESIYQTEADRRLLWERLQQFSFDEPDAVILFRDKLARKNNWSKEFSDRAIAEYRRFIFLCCVVPGGASPSFFVDEVWHLHLTYTTSYWVHLCRDTLKMDLHHYPSKGAKGDAEKHRTWYRDTLFFYEKIFGDAPPPDIWPRPVEEPDRTKPLRLQPVESSKLLFLCLATLPFCFLVSLTGTLIFPFNLNGEAFLVFYPCLGLMVALAYWQFLIREKAAVEDLVHHHFPAGVNAFQLAHFLYGPRRAIQTAILDLVDKGYLTVKDSNTVVVTKHGVKEQSENPLFAWLLYEEQGVELSLTKLEATHANDDGFFQPRLKHIPTLLKAWSAEEVLPILFLLLGLLRAVQGLVAGRPVSHLLELCFLFGLSFVLLRTIFLKEKTVKEAARRRYVAETNYLDSDEVDPVKRFAVQANPSLNEFSEGVVMGLSTSVLFSPPAGGGGADGGGGGAGGGCGGGCGGCGG